LRTEQNIVGTRMWPTYAVKAGALFFLTGATVTLLAGLFQINPVWIYGPFDPARVSAGAQPDWYLGWLEGALRLMPPWEVRAFGFTIPNPFFPGLLIPGLTFNILYAWPWIEAKFTKDRQPHNLLNRPRDVPVRTALGVAGLSFYAVLFVAGGNDVIAGLFHLPLERVTQGLQVMALALPLVAGTATYKICKELKGRAPRTGDEHGHVIVRTADGTFETVEPEKV
jgi:ubiquinol-cytochrome c reductase cytochrome b subunit